MVTIDDVRSVASQLPRSYEVLVRDRVKFRVGRIVYLATLGGVQANLDLRLIMGKRVSIRGCTLRTRTLEEKLAVTRRFATSVLPLLANGKVRPIIEHVYSMAEIGVAHATMAENKNFGKLVVRMD